MKEKHVFAGNNTAQGFYSCFDELIKPYEAKHIYILKGGPGVGKSTFMKNFAIAMIDKGYSMEFIHCSSDNESLDGIIIPELRIAFVDGTAPHTIDPVLPGAVDEIINLGIYLDNHQLEKHRVKIIQLMKNMSQLYESAYRYLNSANVIQEEIDSIYSKFMDLNAFKQICNEAIGKVENLLPEKSPNHSKGKMRKLFSESYTSDGYISHTNSICKESKIWAVVGDNTNYNSEILSQIAEKAIEKGYDTECFLKPLNPEKIQHIFIPEMQLIIVSEKKHMNVAYEEVFDLNSIMDAEKLKKHISEIENNMQLYDLLIKNALEKLSEVKKQHDLLEVFYVNSMDFKGVNECFQSILSQYT